MDAGAVGIVLLAPALLLAKATHVAAEALTNVHGQPTTPLSLINLQTISYNSLDRPRGWSVVHVTYRRRGLQVLRFNMLLREAEIDPSSVRLLRHYPVLSNGVVLIDQFHRDRASLLAWQSVQSTQRRPHLAARFWASFLGTPDGRTVFEGLYAVGPAERLSEASLDPLSGETIPAGTCDRYTLERVADLEPYSGRLLVDWGGGASGKRAWVQRADNQDKPITAILECAFEQPFPGYLAFRHTVGALDRLTPSWADHLRRAKGVYLLGCPDTGRLYTGSATGLGGFWERWQSYLLTGHGGNLGLKECDTSRFNVSILQVAGSTATADDIVGDEQVWKAKLLSREHGHNRN